MTSTRILRSLVAALLLVTCCSSRARAGESPVFDSFYVFGDSLADNGNVWLTSKLLIAARHLAPPAPPPSELPHRAYWQGRFSNGPVAFEYLWDQVKKGGAPSLVPYISAPVLGPTGAVNFAFGGTGTPVLDQTPAGLWAPGLLGQVALFKASLRGRTPSRHALYAIVTGANDYRDDPFNVPMSPVAVVGNIVTAVRSLHKLGARNVLVLTLPNLGCTPAGGAPAACLDIVIRNEAELNAVLGNPAFGPAQLAAVHNFLLARELRKADLGPRVQIVDINVPFTALRASMPGVWPMPALDLFVAPLNVPPTPAGPVPGSACLFVAPALCTDVPDYALGRDAVLPWPPSGFQLLFWDILHPTTFAHRAFAAHMYKQLRR